MANLPLRVAFLGSVAALAFTGASAQEAEQSGTADPQACAVLADRLGRDAAIDAEVRTRVEDVISTGNVTQCELVFTTWERDGSLSPESLELVATEQVTERMIVQQEVEIGAEAAVYQPPAEVTVDTGTPEVVWTMPRQSVTIDEQAPQITVRQGQPRVVVEVPQPRVTVMIPDPEVIVTWPESTANIAALEPTIEVRIPEPVVTVNMPDPIVELSIGGGELQDLVRLEDGRFAPRGAGVDDLEPRITVEQRDATINASQASDAPEALFNRREPVITFEGAEPEVTVQVVGEPDIRVVTEDGQSASGAVAPAVDVDDETGVGETGN